MILDADLAALYGVATKTLVRAFSRNRARFPSDFAFELTAEEFEVLRYQFGTSKLTQQNPKDRRGGRRHLPFAFTEQGIAMLSGVLRSPRAVAANIEIMRAFVQLRQLLSTNAGLAKKLAALEQKYDARFRAVFDAIRELMDEKPAKDSKRIGF